MTMDIIIYSKHAHQIVIVFFQVFSVNEHSRQRRVTLMTKINTLWHSSFSVTPIILLQRQIKEN